MATYSIEQLQTMRANAAKANDTAAVQRIDAAIEEVQAAAAPPSGAPGAPSSEAPPPAAPPSGASPAYTLEQLQTMRDNAAKANDGAAVQRIEAKIKEMSEKPWFGSGVVDTAVDVVRSIPTGMRLGYEGLAGLGGNLYNMEVSAAEKLAEWYGASPETLAEIRASRGKNWLPTSQDINRDTSAFIGEPRQSETRLGEIAQTGAAFLTNPSKGFVRNVVAPTAGTELGGYVGDKYFDNETLGRLIGGGLGMMGPGGTARAGAAIEGNPNVLSPFFTGSAGGTELTLAAHQLMQGNLKEAAGMAASATAPWLTSKALASPAVQTVATTFAANSPRLLDPMTAALLARQAEISERKEQQR